MRFETGYPGLDLISHHLLLKTHHMKMNRRYFLKGYIIILSMIMFSNVNAQSNDKEDARAFVQKFYDWYIVLSEHPINKKNPTTSDVVAVNQHAEYFDGQLRKGLIDDHIAQSKVKGEIVGLDFDPFLAAQDNGFDYQAGNIKQVGNNFFIDIHCAAKGNSKKAILASQIAVIAEVTKIGTSWKFTNFIYPVDGRKDNLMQILTNLQKEREKP